MKHLNLLGALLLLVTASAQKSQLFYASSSTSINKSFFRLGDKVMTINRWGTPADEPYVLLSLHSNETTSIQVAKDYVSKKGGLFIELQNNDQRMISVELYNKMIAIDPNRIYTEEGRTKAMRSPRDRDLRINKLVTDFSHFILNEIPANKVIIAMHNNTDDEYSIRSYVKHPAIKKDAQLVHINPDMDHDDFFYTTSKQLFDKLKAENLNVVLQSSKAYDDGSLAIYYGRMNTPYVNIETEIGHDDIQKKMLDSLVRILETLE